MTKIPFLALTAALLSVGCSPMPEIPVVTTVEVRVPVPTMCPIKAPPPPDHLSVAEGKDLLTKGNSVIAELEETRALYIGAINQIDACKAIIEKKAEEAKRAKEVK